MQRRDKKTLEHNNVDLLYRSAQLCLWPRVIPTRLHSYVEQQRQNEPPSVFSQARLKDTECGPQTEEMEGQFF